MQLDYRAGHYRKGVFSVVCEAIETLEVIRKQLNVMQATPGARFGNAYERGRKAERDGGVTKRDHA